MFTCTENFSSREHNMQKKYIIYCLWHKTYNVWYKWYAKYNIWYVYITYILSVPLKRHRVSPDSTACKRSVSIYIGLVPVGFKGDSHGISICCKLQETVDMLISIRKKNSLKIIEDKACLFADCWSSCKFAEAKQNNAWNHIKHWCITWRGTPHLSTHFPDLLNPKCSFTCIGLHRYINISTKQIANAEFINLTKTHSSMKSAHRRGESWLVAPERRWSPATHTATSPSQPVLRGDGVVTYQKV